MWSSAMRTNQSSSANNNTSNRRSSLPSSEISAASSSALPPLRGATSALNLNQHLNGHNNNNNNSNQSALANAMNQHNVSSSNSSSPQNIMSSSTSAGNNSTRHVEADTITALRSKMEKQRVELDLRTDNVNAIQRNFQRLSEMYAADRQRLQEMEKNAKAMAIEIESLRAEQKLFRALQHEYNGLKNQLSQQEDLYTRQVRAKENEIGDLREKLRQAGENEKALLEGLQKLQGSNEKDANLKEKLALAVASCDRVLVETITTVVEEEKFLRAEVESTFEKKTALVANSFDQNNTNFADLLLMIQQQQQQQQSTNSNNEMNSARKSSSSSSSSPDLQMDMKIKSHSSNLKHFSTILHQKLSSITRTIAANKKEFQISSQETKMKLSALELENKRLQDQLRRAEEENQLTRNVASEGSKLLVRELSDLKRQNADLSEKLMKMQRESVQFGEQLERETVTSTSFAQSLFSTSIQFFSKRIEIIEREWNSKYSSRCMQYEDELKNAKNEISSLNSHLREAMGDQASISNRFEKNLKETKLELDATKTAFAKCEQTLKDTIRKLHSAQVDAAIVKDESTKRGEILFEFYESFKTNFAEVERKHLISFFNSRTNSISADLDSEKQNNKSLVSKYQELEAQLIESRNQGSQQESELALQLRSKNQEVNTLNSERQNLKSTVEAQKNKVAALEDTVKTISEQFRLAKEAEARALSLHAQSVAIADSAKHDAKLHEQARKNIESELDATKERSGLLQRRFDKAENDLFTAQKERDMAVQERKIEVQKISENEIQIQQLKDWANQLRQLHSQSITTVKKILAAEEACESGYSCQSCLEVMKDPIVLAPCGHSFCRGCYNSSNASRKPPVDRAGDSRSYCPECRTHCVTCAVPSNSLDLLSSKFTFRCKALKELQVVLEKSVSAFNN